MNSEQQFNINSRASFATRTLGTISFIILFIAALGMVSSSSGTGSDICKFKVNCHAVDEEEHSEVLALSLPLRIIVKF